MNLTRILIVYVSFKTFYTQMSQVSSTNPMLLRQALEADLLSTLKLSHQNAYAVAPAVSAARSLVEVEYREGNHYSPSACFALRACAALPALRCLHVNLTNMRPELFRALGDILAVTPSLVDLKLEFTVFGDDDSTIIASCALRNPRLALASLDIYASQSVLTALSCATWSSFLAAAPLENFKFVLSLETDDLKCFFPIDSPSPKLKKLDISIYRPHLDRMWAEAIVQVLQQCLQLEILCLICPCSFFNTNDESLRAAFDAMPRIIKVSLRIADNRRDIVHTPLLTFIGDRALCLAREPSLLGALWPASVTTLQALPNGVPDGILSLSFKWFCGTKHAQASSAANFMSRITRLTLTGPFIASCDLSGWLPMFRHANALEELFLGVNMFEDVVEIPVDLFEQCTCLTSMVLTDFSSNSRFGGALASASRLKKLEISSMHIEHKDMIEHFTASITSLLSFKLYFETWGPWDLSEALSLVTRLPGHVPDQFIALNLSMASASDIGTLLDACTEHSPPVILNPTCVFADSYVFSDEIIPQLAMLPVSKMAYVSWVMAYSGDMFRLTLMLENANSVLDFLRSLRSYSRKDYVKVTFTLFRSFLWIFTCVPFEREFFEVKQTPHYDEETMTTWVLTHRIRLARYLLCLSRFGSIAGCLLPPEVLAGNVLPFVVLERHLEDYYLNFLSFVRSPTNA